MAIAHRNAFAHGHTKRHAYPITDRTASGHAHTNQHAYPVADRTARGDTHANDLSRSSGLPPSHLTIRTAATDIDTHRHTDSNSVAQPHSHNKCDAVCQSFSDDYWDGHTSGHPILSPAGGEFQL